MKTAKLMAEAHLVPANTRVATRETERARPAAAAVSRQRPELFRLADGRNGILHSDRIEHQQVQARNRIGDGGGGQWR